MIRLIVTTLAAFAIEIDLGHSHMLKSEFRAHSKKLNMFFGQKYHLFLYFANLFLIFVLDAFQKKRFNFSTFKQQSHDKIVYILIFNQSSSLWLSQKLQSIDIRHYWNHVLYKYAYFINDCLKISHWYVLEMMIKLLVERFQKPSVGVLLEHVGEFEKKIESWRIFGQF